MNDVRVRAVLEMGALDVLKKRHEAGPTAMALAERALASMHPAARQAVLGEAAQRAVERVLALLGEDDPENDDADPERTERTAVAVCPMCGDRAVR